MYIYIYICAYMCIYIYIYIYVGDARRGRRGHELRWLLGAQGLARSLSFRILCTEAPRIECRSRRKDEKQTARIGTVRDDGDRGRSFPCGQTHVQPHAHTHTHTHGGCACMSMCTRNALHANTQVLHSTLTLDGLLMVIMIGWI